MNNTGTNNIQHTKINKMTQLKREKIATTADQQITKIIHRDKIVRARSLVVSDLCSETKGSWFKSGCYLFTEVSSLQ